MERFFVTSRRPAFAASNTFVYSILAHYLDGYICIIYTPTLGLAITIVNQKRFWRYSPAVLPTYASSPSTSKNTTTKVHWLGDSISSLLLNNRFNSHISDFQPMLLPC